MLNDGTGEILLILTLTTLRADVYAQAAEVTRQAVGVHVGATGPVLRTPRGNLAILVTSLTTSILASPNRRVDQ
jgi:hypothetical protein